MMMVKMTNSILYIVLQAMDTTPEGGAVLHRVVSREPLMRSQQYIMLVIANDGRINQAMTTLNWGLINMTCESDNNGSISVFA